MNKLKIGLFGFGCVGQGFYNILEQSSDLPYEVKKVCVKSEEKHRPPLNVQWVFSPDEILKDEEISVVVEAIDDAEAALAIVKHALAKGKTVISANKKMIAENIKSILHLEKQTEGKFFCEGAVAGSIPVLQTIAHFYQFDQVKAIEGILNGSTNYILTQLLSSDKNYEQALAQAQVCGFAESDPKLDMEGHDARYKLSILVALLFRTHVSPDEIPCVGIQNILTDDIAFAKKNNLSIKLIATARKTKEGLETWVLPQFIPVNSSLGQVQDEYNAIQLESSFTGNQTLIGKGAGELPTGMALIGDLNRCKLSKGDFAVEVSSKEKVPITDPLINVYYNHSNLQLINWDLFDTIYEKSSNSTRSYALGAIRTSQLEELITEDSSVIALSGSGVEFSTQKLQYSRRVNGTFSR